MSTRASPGTAVLVTALALALVNAGLAALIAYAVTSTSFMPIWLGMLLLALGVLAAAAAVRLWREYLRAARDT